MGAVVGDLMTKDKQARKCGRKREAVFAFGKSSHARFESSERGDRLGMDDDQYCLYGIP